jgi:hypothetical protein
VGGLPTRPIKDGMVARSRGETRRKEIIDREAKRSKPCRPSKYMIRGSQIERGITVFLYSTSYFVVSDEGRLVCRSV